MNSRPLFFLASTVAGFAIGAMWSDRGDENSSLQKVAQSERPSSLDGAGDARETALGNSLSVLLQKEKNLRELAELATALDQLDSPRIAQLLDRLERAVPEWPPHFDDRITWIFNWWLKRDPAAANRWAQPRIDALAQEGPMNSNFDYSGRGRFIDVWAQANPDAASEFAQSHPHCGTARVLLQDVLNAWKDRPDSEKLAALLAFPASHARDVALEKFHDDWARRDPAAAVASAQALPAGIVRDAATAKALGVWAHKDAAAAFYEYKKLGLNEPTLLSAILEKRASKNPAEAIEWLQQLDAAQVARSAPKVVNEWAKKDAVAAMNWAMENGVRLSMSEEVYFDLHHDGFGRSNSMGSRITSPLATALASQPEATLRWMLALPSGDDRDRVFELAARAAKAPDQALTAFAELPPAAQTRTAASVARLFEKDRERGQQWAASLPAGATRIAAWKGMGASNGTDLDLPPGPDRDAYIAGTLQRGGEVRPPAETLAKIFAISDPATRRASFDEIMSNYQNFDSFADQMGAALDSLNVPEEWKQRWRTPVAK